jgi:hypothetical protein
VRQRHRLFRRLARLALLTGSILLIALLIAQCHQVFSLIVAVVSNAW